MFSFVSLCAAGLLTIDIWLRRHWIGTLLSGIWELGGEKDLGLCASTLRSAGYNFALQAGESVPKLNVSSKVSDASLHSAKFSSSYSNRSKPYW